MNKSQKMKDEAKLFAITGQFETPDEIMHAAESAASRYRKYDVHTPYPVHGMDGAMGLGESPIGWVTLIVGSTCMLLMLAFISWISLVDYPTVWAGKPYFNLPGYIPILFEVTVLTGAVTTVLVLFLIVSGFPNNSHPLHDTPYMRRTSDDRFGLCIEAADENFNEAEARAFLETLGAKDIAAVHYDVAEAHSGLSLTNPLFLGALTCVVIGVSGAAYFALNRMVFLPPYNWMSVQEKVVPQTLNTLFADGRAMQKPVAGTVSRNYLPEPFEQEPDAMAVYFSNPLPQTQEVFDLGKEKYESRCSACHGFYGAGDSRLVGPDPTQPAYPAPPTLHSKKLVEEWSDGRLYHVITYGQNIMPGYAKQLTKDERWAVIHYIRALQRSLNPKETDLQ